MKKFLLAAAALALMGNVAFAGPNAGGTIFVHNPNLAYPGGPGYSACGQGTAPGSCEQAVTRLDGNTNAQVVWKVYAAFAPCTAPRLKALDMGLRYQQYDVVNGGPGIYILAYGACIGDLNQGAAEFPVNGWPGNGGQDAIVFQNAVTTTLAECYWFAGYNYYYGGVGGPQLFQLTAGQYGGNFADDGVPPSQDPIAGFGALGFGMNGTVICPGAGAEGACCDFSTGNCTLTCANDCTFTFLGPGSVCNPETCPVPLPTGACCDISTGNCTVTTQADCQFTWLGPGVPCDPNTCQPVPTKNETWGQIKHQYR